MIQAEIDKVREDLLNMYPECHVLVAEDKKEVIAEVSQGVAVAVIERSLPHFHLQITETYRVLRGTLYVACAGEGHVLCTGDTLTIKPGQVHSARGAGESAWVEVRSVPPWSANDHFIL